MSHFSAFWLGGTDTQKESEWIWAFSKTRVNVNVTDWHNGTESEPNNYNGMENCMTLHRNFNRYEWNDEFCGNSFRFICEQK